MDEVVKLKLQSSILVNILGIYHVPTINFKLKALTLIPIEERQYPTSCERLMKLS